MRRPRCLRRVHQFVQLHRRGDLEDVLGPASVSAHSVYGVPCRRYDRTRRSTTVSSSRIWRVARRSAAAAAVRCANWSRRASQSGTAEVRVYSPLSTMFGARAARAAYRVGGCAVVVCMLADRREDLSLRCDVTCIMFAKNFPDGRGFKIVQNPRQVAATPAGETT